MNTAAAGGAGVARTAVNHCPYCGEGQLRPSDAEYPGAWYCRSCLRLFSVTHHGVRRSDPTRTPQEPR